MKDRFANIGFAILILLAWVPACRREDPAPPAPAAAKAKETVLVFAAASTTNALNEIKAQFTKDSGVAVQTSYAASSTLAEQIGHGADADLLLSADTKWADYLAKKDLVLRQQDLLGNRLVIVVPADSKIAVERPEDLLAAGIEHLALGEPQSVPAGMYAKQALTKLGLWDRLKGKVVSAQDVRHALAYVETGSAEAGIVYATDAAISKRVKVAAEVPEKLTGPIRYPLVLLKHAEGSEAAQAFYRYLSSPAAAKVFQTYGFTILNEGKAALEGTALPAGEMPFPLLSPMEWSALRLSFQVALVAALFSLPFAVAAGYVLARFHFPGKWILEIVIDLPLVMPPVVTGYLLLVAFAPHGPLGSILRTWLGIKIVFTWLGAALASAAVSFPLMVRAIHLAFQGVDPRFEMAARSLGASRLGAFFTIALPLARRGLIAGFMLAFARSLGEFGATIMVAGNIEGQTRTIPLAIYTLANTPDGMQGTWRLVGLSILLACAALAVGAWLQRRRPRDVRS